MHNHTFSTRLWGLVAPLLLGLFFAGCAERSTGDSFFTLTVAGQSASTNEDTPLSMDVTPGQGTFSYGLVSRPQGGVLSGTPSNLTYTPNPNFNGTDSFRFLLSDGVHDSQPATVSITVLAVNDAPSFNLGANQPPNTGPQVVANWASAISAGPNETGQSVTFAVTNDNNGAFTTQPTIDAAGTLRFRLSGPLAGTVTVTVVLSDDGGTANGGSDTSAPQTFTIGGTPTLGTPSVTAPARFLDVNRNGVADAGDQVVVPFSETIVVNSAASSSLSLPVTGDAFGAGASLALGPGSQAVTVTLGTSPALKTRQSFSAAQLGTNSASGVDVSG